MADKVKVGVIGCGNISPQYFTWMKTFHVLEVVACADLDIERANERAEEFEIPRECSVDELVGDDEIQIVVNIYGPQGTR